MIMTFACIQVSRGCAKAVKGWHQSDSLRHSPERDRDTPWGKAMLLSDTLLRLTAHWCSPNSSKKTSSICWANRGKESRVPYCLLSQQSWPWCAETEGGSLSLRKSPTGNGTSVTQFLASFSPFLNSIYIWQFCWGNMGVTANRGLHLTFVGYSERTFKATNTNDVVEKEGDNGRIQALGWALCVWPWMVSLISTSQSQYCCLPLNQREIVLLWHKTAKQLQRGSK